MAARGEPAETNPACSHLFNDSCLKQLERIGIVNEKDEDDDCVAGSRWLC